MKSLFTLNIVYGEDEKRGFVKLNAISGCARRHRDHTRRSGRHLPLRAELRGAAVAVDHLRRAVAAILWLWIWALFSWYASSSGVQ